MTNATAKITKTDQIKTAIMEILNTQESATREEINTAAGQIASTRTISRALASLKLDGRIQQLKDDANNFSWISNESPKKAEVSEAGKKAAEIADEIKKERKETPPIQKAAEIADGIKKEKTDKKPAIIETKTADDKAGKTMIPANDEKGAKKNDKKKTPASEKSDKKADKATGADPKKEKKVDPKKDTPKKTDKKKPTEKKTITKDNLVDAGKEGVKRNPATGGAKPKKATGEKKPGIIANIIKSITKKHRTKKQILARLEKAFPERDPKKMVKTINVQVPSRLRKDKGLEIEKTDKGYKIISK